MNIYAILSSKPHNAHYLNRYIKFIESRTQASCGEDHHICPKADDLFPEYKSLNIFPWNKITLSFREHYIAHLLLHKAYGNSQSRAFYMMSSINNCGGRLYESAKTKFVEWLKHNNPMNNLESRKKCSQPGTKNGMYGKPGSMLGKTGELNPNFGKSRPEHSRKMSGSGNPSYGVVPRSKTCEHCGKSIDYRNYSRWHGNNCKLKAL